MIPAPSISRAARTAVGEHAVLHRLLSQVQAAIQPRSGSFSDGPDVVSAGLDTLRGPLRAHFEEEERAGLFEQIEERSPEQAPVCDRLRREHASLIRRLDALRGTSALDRRLPGWAGDVRAFLSELDGHERRETDLLTRALDGSTPAAD